MSNTWFQFQQFKIRQEKSAMKVSTDACIFGAWAAKNQDTFFRKVLDTGTGTGLLSLMLLQKNPQINITALEPEVNAAVEAAFNFRKSKWSNRVNVVQETLQDFYVKHPQRQFDFIICNPPFFQNQLLGKNQIRNKARHNSLLPQELADYSSRLVKEGGQLAVLYPASNWDKWLEIAEDAGWRPKAVLNIQPNAQKPVNRICGIFELGKKPNDFSVATLVIRDEDGVHTAAMSALLKGFYLNP